MNRAQRRGRIFDGPRPVADLIVTRFPEMPFVLVGMVGDGYVRLTAAEARELAARLTEMADTVGDAT